MSIHLSKMSFSILLACLVLLQASGCGLIGHKPSRAVLSTVEIKSISDRFEKVTNDHLQAWVGKDVDRLRQMYTEDIVHHDANTELFVGLSGVLELAHVFTSMFPAYDNRLANTFIGREDGFYVEESWNWVPYDYVKNVFSKDHPLINDMWLTLRDGKISYWWLFYDQAVFQAGELDFDQKMLQDYAAAWSSGDAQAVTSLYSLEAVRKDSLFGVNQQGSVAIQEYAQKFFSWYPGIRLSLLQSFGEYPKLEKRGGVYALNVTDRAGKPCQVQELVLLEPDSSGQKIAQEWVFYQADSLIACGWAR